MSNTITVDVPNGFSTFPGIVSNLAGTTVEATYSDEGELEHFDVSDGHWGSPDDLEANNLEAAIDAAFSS